MSAVSTTAAASITSAASAPVAAPLSAPDASPKKLFKYDVKNDLEKSPWGHKCTLILPKIPLNRELRKGNSELFFGSGELLRNLKILSVSGFTIKVKSS